MYKTILIADDHFVVRVGIAMILKEKYKDIKIIYAENYYEVSEQLNQKKIELLILDINMPGSIGKDNVKEIKSIQPEIKVLIFTTNNEAVASQYIKEGADGYLNKLSDEKMILKAVESIYENGHYYSSELVQQLVNNSIKKPISEILSERELQVFKLLAQGNGNLEIANILGVKESTAGTYKKRIYEKLEINNLITLHKIYLESFL